jgi:hypothetical protein
VRINGADSAFPIEETPVGPIAPTLNLRSAYSEQVLEVYQEMTGRTVLRSGNLPGAKLDLQTPGALPPSEAAGALETLLAEKGIAMKSIGKKFVCAVKTGDEAAIDELPPLPAAPAGRVNPSKASVDATTPPPLLESLASLPVSGTPDRSRIPRPPGAPSPPVRRDVRTREVDEVLPAGMVKFHAADIRQALEVYQELTARTVLFAPRLSGKVTVRTQTSLSRAEASWLMEAIMQLTGTRVVPDGEKFAVALPLGTTPPVVSPNSLVRPDDERTLPEGLLQFSDAEPAAILPVYAELCHRQAGAVAQIPSARLSMRARNTMTTTEALHGLDVLVALHGLEFVPVDNDKITVRTRPAAADTAPVPK